MTGISAAAEAEDATTVDAVDAIEAVDESLVPDAIDVATADDTVVVGDTSVELSVDAADGVVVTAGEVDLEIGLPFAEEADDADVIDGTVVFDNNNGSTTSPLVHEDGSVQFVTTIADASAPTEFSYDFGGAIQLVLDPGGFVAVSLTEDPTSVLAVVAPAWAVDARGEAVSTHYIVSGGVLTQVVDLSQSSVAFPVVADPWLGKTLLSSVTYITRPGGTAVKVVPTSWGRSVALGAGGALGPSITGAFWSEYTAKVSSTYETQDMRWQLNCHINYAQAKSSWNLDSYIHRSSYFDYIAHGCN